MTEKYKAEIDAINKEAWDIRVNDSNKAHDLSRHALALAISFNYTKGQAEASRTLGFTFIRLSQHNEALIHLDNALQMFKLINDLCGQSDVYEYYGIIRRSFGDYKSSLDALYKALELRQQTGYKEGESLSLYHLGVTYRYLGNLEQALDYFLQSLAVARLINSWIPESYSLNNLGSIYLELNDLENALKYFNESLEIRKRSKDKWGEAGCLDNIGHIYFKINECTKAINYCSQSLEISKSVGDKKGEGNALFHLAEIHLIQKKYEKAKTYANESIGIRKTIGDKKGEAELYLMLASLGSFSEEIILIENYLKNALALADETKAADLLQKVHERCYNFYKQQKQHEKALVHLEASYAFEREVHSNALNQKILNLEIKHKIEQSKKETEIFRLRNEELAKLYEESKRQKEEIELQKAQVEITLSELKSTQAQLIQSEKMASLGELTAGIAHEIQNPLNFVNNFSEVNKEMLDELQTELKSGNVDEAINISNDIKDNEEKINHHGKRADAIVKGMLQHSRQTKGIKEFTDIYALCDEYLRLSYHGLRAKDKSFNADFKMDFDETIGKINIVPQNIGRVLLNLFNNAFYATNSKQKNANENYKPLVSIQTKKINDKIEIKVSDNGNGIPQIIIDKIFQPFFTTKPTGEGTGLGLSLAYDIITKEHNGNIKVESIEHEGTTFIITLPV